MKLIIHAHKIPRLWSSCCFFLPLVSFNPTEAPETLPMLVTEETDLLQGRRRDISKSAQTEDEEEQSEYLNLPPLILSDVIRSARRKSNLDSMLNVIDPILNNFGSLLFIIGSLCYVPSIQLNHGGKFHVETIGAALFLIGSILFFATSCISFFRAGAWQLQDWGLAANGLCYMIGNSFFVFGSILFIPAMQSVVVGLNFFVLGSVVNSVAFCTDGARTFSLYHNADITYGKFKIEICVIVLYVAGCVLFTIGCFYYYPKLLCLHGAMAMAVFLLGSVSFQVAALIAPGMRFLRHYQRLREKRRWTSSSVVVIESTINPIPTIESNEIELSERQLAFPCA